MSLPLLAAALIGLRHGAPARPAVAGAIAGLVSAGLAATLYASHCTDDLPLFVATWYTLATALVAAIGALAGSKVLRFWFRPPARVVPAACGGSAAPVVRSRAASVRRWPCRPQGWSVRRPESSSRMLTIAFTVDHDRPPTLARIITPSARVSIIMFSAIDIDTLASAAIEALVSSNLPAAANEATWNSSSRPSS